MSVIAARLMPLQGRHRLDPRNSQQWSAKRLVGDRSVPPRDLSADVAEQWPWVRL